MQQHVVKLTKNRNGSIGLEVAPAVGPFWKRDGLSEADARAILENGPKARMFFFVRREEGSRREQSAPPVSWLQPDGPCTDCDGTGALNGAPCPACQGSWEEPT
jgi:hypothetical protein